MADFVAVLRKTIGALGDNTPEMREKVYDKARTTIDAKLAAINPAPPQAVIDRQKKALEDAIAVVRADYAEAEAEEDDGLEDAFAALESVATTPPSPPVAPAPVAPKPDLTNPAGQTEEATSPAPIPVRAADDAPRQAAASRAFDPARDDVEPEERQDAPAADAVVADRRERREPARKTGTNRRFGLIAALVALLVVAGGGYALWMNRGDLSAPVALDTTPPASETAADGATEPSGEVAETEPPAEEPAAQEEEVAALPPPAEEGAEQAAPTDAEKFTQRLMPDGTEVDEGPAGGERSVGEGTSVAAVAQPGEAQTDAQPGGEEAAEAGQEGADPTTPGVAVGQRAIFYEERTSAAQGSAEMGSIVWSTVQESPGGDLPPEPAIRAEATIPGKDVQLRMTIRRNGDDTLPASHIIEMIFLTPDGFSGGAISNVSRISFKETEQAAGNPLIGIPAKIADGFFLIALGDAPAEIEANMTLLRRQSWVDIPIVYQSGRRALLSMEKGIPGDRVFQEVMQAWDAATSG
ncbi:hypothetical protein FY036_04705 [Mesorhizobium microcysteis]|uniref:Uncharacterized protein n=1 Tax=Neoaquamicrobium microcysteis TaxID=2682781 RepID=A0A5D4H1C4_9HYPH|nr:hypothetical protein [Mesorhizobium microcysteis]TYR34656.1 hypothetical protein FY036_04705 [Mesorhizobium microcysteis]